MNIPPLPAMIATHTAQAIRRTGATLATQPAGQINAQQPSGHRRVAVVICISIRLSHQGTKGVTR